MTTQKRVLSLILVLALVFALAIPVAALDSEWRYEFRYQFPMLSQGSGHTGYVAALQRFLYAFPSTRSTIINAGGVDGSFGSGTGSAVRLFQTYATQYLIPGMSIDGIAGGDTWASIAIALTLSGGYMQYSGSNVYKLSSGTLQYLNRNGGYTYFHTIVGDVPIY